MELGGRGPGLLMGLRAGGGGGSLGFIPVAVGSREEQCGLGGNGERAQGTEGTREEAAQSRSGEWEAWSRAGGGRSGVRSTHIPGVSSKLGGGPPANTVHPR